MNKIEIIDNILKLRSLKKIRLLSIKKSAKVSVYLNFMCAFMWFT